MLKQNVICYRCLESKEFEANVISEQSLSQIGWKIVDLKKELFLCKECQNKKKESLQYKKQRNYLKDFSKMTLQERNAWEFMKNNPPNNPENLFFWHTLIGCGTTKRAMKRLEARGIIIFYRKSCGWKLVQIFNQ